MPAVPTTVVSDLHLGTRTGADVARSGPARDRLLEALSGSGPVVLLGDLLELREGPLHDALEAARPTLQAIGEVVHGRRVTVVPGNHDHQLGEPWLARRRLEAGELGAEGEWPVERGDGPLGRMAEWMPGAEVTVAYPGLRLRPDVYATHGHYLDLHLTVPRLESIIASALARATGRSARPTTPADHEAVLAPLYGFTFSVAQGASNDRLTSGGSVSRKVWRRARAGGDGGAAGRLLLGRLAIPAGVAALNGLGLGPFRAELTGHELRRSGLRAMADVVRALGVSSAEHVIFGHTHRPGPLAGDDVAEWSVPDGGPRLWNSGSWYQEDVFLDSGDPTASPYWPGTVLTVPDEEPPEVRNVLSDVDLEPLARRR